MLANVVNEAYRSTLERYGEKGLGPDQLAISAWCRDSDNGEEESAHVHGERPFYPASVVKAFYLAYAAHRIGEGTFAPSEEFYRAARDMIVDSSNDATGYVLDALCGTTPGPELEPEALSEFMERRGTVDRFFASRGYAGVTARQRTYNEGPYGREKQGMGLNHELRNQVTANACVRLFRDFASGAFGGPDEADWARGLLRRPLPVEAGTDPQALEYIGRIVTPGSQLYSKAGWTSEVRHDAAWVSHSSGSEICSAILTEGVSDETSIIPFAAYQVFGFCSRN